MAADVFMRPAQLLGAAGPLSPRTEPDEDSSDTDDGGTSPGGGRRCGPRRGQPPGPQIIHSGHFMVSSPHSEHPPKKGYDFDTVNEQTCQTYQFGAARGGGGAGGRLSIDASLTKLFECMSLAYRYRPPPLGPGARSRAGLGDGAEGPGGSRTESRPREKSPLGVGGGRPGRGPEGAVRGGGGGAVGVRPEAIGRGTPGGGGAAQRGLLAGTFPPPSTRGCSCRFCFQ